MPLAKNKKAVGLGNALMNDRFGKGKGADRKKVTAMTRTNHETGEQYMINVKAEAAWVKMRSITEQGALDEFLATAELVGTDFTAEKMNNVNIIHTDQKNPYLLSAAEERQVLGQQEQHRGRLSVPRRPHWDASTTPEKLDELERESFLNWRRGLAELQENQDLLLTPFERNLEIWRQLWRVIERSDVVVQIVDARNPLMFRSEDLESYVKEVNEKKENLLLINKADMMTYKQRKAWANYLDDANINFKFFSASLAKEYNESREFERELDSESAEKSGSMSAQEVEHGRKDAAAGQEEVSGFGPSDSEGGVEGREDVEMETDSDTRILTVDELEDLFLQYKPTDSKGDRKLQVGLVGYPNVGKSSTINALVGAKKVSVSATPGKTKHFQTIHLSENIILCDCPGLVFPNFATTKADLVCNGVLHIDQLREYTGPAGLVARRIPKPFLEAVYGIQIRTRAAEEGGTGVLTAEELLSAYARHRGFMTQGLGQPDQSRAVRYILKDYVNGKLLYVEPPPGDYDAVNFNKELYDISHVPAKRRLAIAKAMSSMSMENDAQAISDISAIPQGVKAANVDRAFFKALAGNAGHVSRPFNFKYSEQGKALASGKQMSARKTRAMIALEMGINPKEVQLMSGKKHYKGGPKAKGKKRAKNHDDD